MYNIKNAGLRRGQSFLINIGRASYYFEMLDVATMRMHE